MKKITFLLCVAILTLLLLPQNSKAQTVYRLDSIQSFEWNTFFPNNWSMQIRSHYTYNNGGVLPTNQLLLQKDNTTPLTWFNGLQVINTYTIDDKIESSIFQSWNGTQWLNSFKNEYSYDGSGNNNLITNYFYGVDWMVTTQELMTYNGSNLVIESITQQLLGSWVNSEKIIYTYAGNLLMQKDYYDWEITDWATMANSRYIYTYNGANVSQILMQTWDSSWINESQELYSYDVNDLIDEVLTNLWSDPDWIPQYKNIYYWTDSGLGITSENLFEGKAYPNPFKGELNISLKSALESEGVLQIFDIHGKEISRTELNRGVKTIKINNPYLSKGIYFIQVKSGVEKSTFKVIKQ